MIKYEYEIRSLFYFNDYANRLSENKLNEHGLLGWELVQVIDDIIIFKRNL